MDAMFEEHLKGISFCLNRQKGFPGNKNELTRSGQLKVKGQTPGQNTFLAINIRN